MGFVYIYREKVARWAAIRHTSSTYMTTCIFVKNKNNNNKKRLERKCISRFWYGGFAKFSPNCTSCRRSQPFPCLFSNYRSTPTPPPRPPQALDDFLYEWFIVVTVSPPLALPKHKISKQKRSFEWSHLKMYLTNSEVFYAAVFVSRCVTRRIRLRSGGDSFKRYNYVITKKKVTLHCLHQRQRSLQFFAQGT